MPASKDGLDFDVEAAVAACGGDLKDTIKALIVTNRLLWSELNDAKRASAYERGKVRKAKA